MTYFPYRFDKRSRALLRLADMAAPIDGIAGSVWRTVTLPARALAPLVLLARRAIRGAYWTESVREHPAIGPRLDLSDHDDLQTPADGAGPLNHRTYVVRIVDSPLDPEQLLTEFRRDPNRFSPTSYATFVPDPAPDGLVEGEEYAVKLPGPWDGPVHVRKVEPTRIRFETLDGHMEAGWIEFRTGAEGDVTIFTIESIARSGDRVFDAIYHDVGFGKLLQSEMWARVLEFAVEASGGRQHGRLEFETTMYLGAADR